MSVTSTPVPSEPLLTTSVKSNSFSALYLSLEGDQIFQGTLAPGYKITTSNGNNGTVVLTLSYSK